MEELEQYRKDNVSLENYIRLLEINQKLVEALGFKELEYQNLQKHFLRVKEDTVQELFKAKFDN